MSDGFSAASTAASVAAISARDLVKSYGSVEAVKGVSFDVDSGETFGLLGPNGAGKTTTISMLCTMTIPTGGSASVAGFDVVAQPAEVRRQIGLVFQASTVDDYLTAMQNLRFHAVLYSLPKKGLSDRLRQVLDLVGLWDRRASRVRTFSGGMKRRLEIARGLLHSPRVLFLDEPTVGLDPQTRNRIWEYVDELKQREAVTIFLTTHYMDEAEHCDRIAIIDGGRLVVMDTPAALKAAVGRDRIELHTDDDDAAVSRLAERFGLAATSAGGTVTTQVANGERVVPQLCAGLGLAVYSVNVIRPSLDDVFMAHTGRAIRDSGM
ncbi:MAG TPA: ATP-binding cassette domain-containing protein [Acidimicrobiales bacterium]|nr:ATP-binding cassette domain-containing protein [Acidimicrobiales bacterium]